MTRHTVAEVMTTSVVSAYRGASFKKVARSLIDREVTAMPVIDEDRHVVGVVSESDLLSGRRRWRRGKRYRPGVAGELMTSPAITVTPETTVTRAARLLERHRIKRLPVIDGNGHLVGIVSRRDLLRVFTRPDEEIRREITEEIFECLLRIEPGTVSVRVEDGVATLTGRLERGLVPIAVSLAAGVDGVVAVTDELNDVTGARPFS